MRLTIRDSGSGGYDAIHPTSGAQFRGALAATPRQTRDTNLCSARILSRWIFWAACGAVVSWSIAQVSHLQHAPSVTSLYVGRRVAHPYS